MTVADLIAELSKLPPHAEVAVALEMHDYEACDVNGDPVVLNLVSDVDCFALTEVVNEGTWVNLIGAGPWYGDGHPVAQSVLTA